MDKLPERRIVQEKPKGRRRIAVLTHAAEDFHSSYYLLRYLIDMWGKAGIDAVVLRGTARYEEAEALILHVDLTVIPDDYLAFSRRYPLVINGRVRDISKRRVSTNLVGIRDAYDGPVIVKTDRNFGGVPERGLPSRGPWRRLSRGLCGRLPWSVTGRLQPGDYPVYPSRRSVPLAVWLNPRLVVEKFIPEREGSYYALRQWVFLGDRGISQRILSREPVIKSSNVAHRERDVPVPEGMRALRKRMGFDYGKFDYVVYDGEPALLDANRTPGVYGHSPSPRLRDSLEEFAKGLYALIGPARPAAGSTGS
jgi:hypothetical protein